MVLTQQAISDSLTFSDSVNKSISKAIRDGIITSDSALKAVTKAISDGASVSDAIATVSSIATLVPSPRNRSDQLKLPIDILTDIKVINSSTYIDLSCIDNRDYKKSLYHIYNSDPANSMTFSIYGNNNDNGGLAPAFDTSWVVLPNAKDVVLAAVTPTSYSLTDIWRWILIRGKNAGANVTSYQLMITASKY